MLRPSGKPRFLGAEGVERKVEVVAGPGGAANAKSASSPWEGLVGVREWEWWVGVLSTNQLGKQRDGGINKG